MERSDAGFLFVFLEGVQVYHPLETISRQLRQFNRLNGNEAAASRTKARRCAFSAAPQFLKVTGRLEAFLEMLPACYRYAFEFRHASWYQFDVFDILTTHNVSLGISDHADAPAPWQAAARHVYIRGHGPKGNYAGHYSRNALRSWATRVLRWSDEGRQVFVYFDNDQKAAAPQDAHRLLKLVANSAPPKGKENYPTSQVQT
jgi:uncharacterized protein YecE (DUF72 family)